MGTMPSRSSSCSSPRWLFTVIPRFVVGIGRVGRIKKGRAGSGPAQGERSSGVRYSGGFPSRKVRHPLIMVLIMLWEPMISSRMAM